jgi:hypothetical protein
MMWRRRKKAMSEETGSATPAAAIEKLEKQKAAMADAEVTPPTPQQPPVDPRTLPPPDWFVNLVLILFSLYPRDNVGPNTMVGWWAHLGRYSPMVLGQAFSISPSRWPNDIVPTAERVRQIAEGIAQAQVQPKP